METCCLAPPIYPPDGLSFMISPFVLNHKTNLEVSNFIWDVGPAQRRTDGGGVKVFISAVAFEFFPMTWFCDHTPAVLLLADLSPPAGDTRNVSSEGRTRTSSEVPERSSVSGRRLQESVCPLLPLTDPEAEPGFGSGDACSCVFKPLFALTSCMFQQQKLLN